MTSSLRARVTALAIACMLGSLAGVGLGTALLLRHSAGVALDRMLLAAALTYAESTDDSRRFGNHHIEQPLEVHLWNPEAPDVEPSLHRLALASERPVWVNDGDKRILLLTVETDEHLVEEHKVVVATARRVTWASATVPFLLPFVATSLFVTLIGALVLSWAMRQLLLPLEHAGIEIGKVSAHTVGLRLKEAGPPEIQQLLVATNLLLARLQDAFQTQAGFTAQAAHELRTPVTILRTEVELALRRPRTVEEHRRILEQLGSDLDRLDALVEGLLLLARVDTGHIEQGRTVEHLSTPVHLALKQQHAALAAAGCTVRVSLDVDPELLLHVALVSTAISTLLRNVVVHAPGSAVTIETRHTGTHVDLVIVDDGPGIASPERMQERFQRQGPGLGLGLPIAREIVARHGGTLEATSQPGSGTTVRLSFPA